MPNYIYRGTSLSAANDSEIPDNRIDGFEADIYKGRIDADDVDRTVAKTTPLDEVPWWTPEGEDRGYLHETQGVTGGITDTIGTAVDFSHGAVPLVFYLREWDVSGSPTPVRYTYDFFSTMEGSLAWVYGENVSGEVHGIDIGLVGLTTEGETGPLVWVWGRDEIRQHARTYEEERELLVFDSSVDISGAVESVAILLDGRRTAESVLASFPDYNAGFGPGGEDVSRWPRNRVLETLHETVRERANGDIGELWTINLSARIAEKLAEIPESAFDYAYDGTTVYDDYGSVPGHLLGR